MGCLKTEEQIEKFLLFSGNQVWFLKNGEILNGILEYKSMTEEGDFYKSAYRIRMGWGKNITYEVALEKDIFPSFTSATRSLMSCELEQKIPELLEDSFTKMCQREDVKILKKSRWNRFLDKVIKSIQKLKV